jgi:hypothetical protein
MVNKIKKSLIAVLILGQLTLPLLSSAQVFTVPVSDSNTGVTPGGLAGIASSGVIQGALQALETKGIACGTAEQLFESTDSAAQLGFSGLSIIGGDAVLLAKLTAEVNAYNGFILCRQTVLDLLKAVVTPSVFTSNMKQTIQNDQSAAVSVYKNKLASAQARLDNARQGFWKTLVLNILLKTSKAVANALVNKLVNQFKISNYKQYADSIATLVYDNQFIRQTYPDAQGQYMARAILQQPELRNQIPSSMFIAADAALGFDKNALNPNDPNFYTKMAAVGTTSANPYYTHTTYVAGVDQAHAASLFYAQNQVNQGNGYKAPVNCAGSLAQQQAIDAQAKALGKKLDDRKALLNNLQTAQKLGQNVSTSDLAKAQADYNLANNAWNDAPDAVPGNSPAIIMCEAIVSPATLVNKGIDKAFDAFVAPISQYNDNNLPGFISLITDVASQVGSSLIFGGPNAAKGAILVNEGKLANGAITAAAQAGYNHAVSNLANGISFDAQPDPSSNNTFTLSWSIQDKNSLPTASFMTLSGSGLNLTVTDHATNKQVPVKYKLTDSVKATVTLIPDATDPGTYLPDYPYTLTVFDASGKPLTSTSLTLTTDNSKTSYNSNAQTAVLGAYTNKPSLQIRGPEPEFNPRGE